MRVCLKSDDSIIGRIGRIVSDLAPNEFTDGDVLVEWQDSGERTRIRRSALVELDAERPDEPTQTEKLVDQVQHLRHMLNTSCDLIIREIERGTK